MVKICDFCVPAVLCFLCYLLLKAKSASICVNLRLKPLDRIQFALIRAIRVKTFSPQFISHISCISRLTAFIESVLIRVDPWLKPPVMVRWILYGTSHVAFVRATKRRDIATKRDKTRQIATLPHLHPPSKALPSMHRGCLLIGFTALGRKEKKREHQEKIHDGNE